MSKPIQIGRRLQKRWPDLPETQQERVEEIIRALPDLIKNPHAHSGFGFRRIRGRAYYEARIDLRWRLVMRIDEQAITLIDVLNHDQVRRLG